jgi:hypothetical protein
MDGICRVYIENETRIEYNRDCSLTQRSQVVYEEVSLNHVIGPEKERVLVQELDWWLLPVSTLAYISCSVDGAPVGNARIMGMQKGLDLVGYRFSIVL